MAQQIRRKVAIIGAGCSGLASIKCCLDEGLEPVCFEKREDLGGLWNFSAESRPGEGNIYDSCVINTSKEMTAFSDFPVPSHFPIFMPHRFMLEYFKLYAEKFDLKKYIRFSTCVDQISKSNSYEENGSWIVSYRNNEDIPADGVTMEIFDAVMVCTGHHVHPHIPKIYGMEDFRGPKLHSHEYKRPEPFQDKRVLVIGMGNSAVDIAVDVSRTAKKVFMSTRRGAWIISRMGPLGYPADALANSRFLFSLPHNWLQKMIELMANFRFDHCNYGVQAEHRALEAHPTINDELPYRIMTGTVQVRPEIATVAEDGVLFADATLEDIDAIILATGYNYQYRMLDESVLNLNDNDTDLYKYTFPMNLSHPTLAIVGHVQAIGSVIPIAEMQARWITRTFSGKCKLPSKDEMLADINAKRRSMAKQYVESRRHKLQTYWIQYMDEIAELIGAKPDLWQLAKGDWGLALRCFFGPCLPAQYRLQGPGAWDGASAAIRSCFNNCVSGTKRRRVWPQQRKKNSADIFLSGAKLCAKEFCIAFVFCLVVIFLYRMCF